MARLLIYGAGGLGREVWAMSAPDFDEVVFCDDSRTEPVMGCPIIATSDIRDDDEISIAVSDPAARRRIAERLTGHLFASLRARSAEIAPDVEIGEGAFFCHFSHAAVSARIGRHLLCHIHAYVGHENVVGDFVTLAPRASLNGNVTVGDGAFIGAGAVIRQGLTIGEGAVIGMGAVVTKDVAPFTTVVGTPARSMRLNPERQAAH